MKSLYSDAGTPEGILTEHPALHWNVSVPLWDSVKAVKVSHTRFRQLVVPLIRRNCRGL